jgi:hypothetical protein
VLLRIAPRDAGTPRAVSIPTLREEDRVAVLRLLDEKGVRRAE